MCVCVCTRAHTHGGERTQDGVISAHTWSMLSLSDEKLQGEGSARRAVRAGSRGDPGWLASTQLRAVAGP